MAQSEEIANAEPDALTLESQNRRLQVLVGELLETNQALRFKLDELERQTEGAARGVAFSCAAALLL